MAKDMVAFMESLAIRSSHIIGITMGGTIALQLILDQPTMVDTLLLTNTFAKLRPQKFSFWFFYAIRLALVHIFGIPKQADFVARRLFPDPEQAQLREVLKLRSFRQILVDTAQRCVHMRDLIYQNELILSAYLL